MEYCDSANSAIVLHVNKKKRWEISEKLYRVEIIKFLIKNVNKNIVSPPQCPHMSLWTSWSSLLGMAEV